MSAEPVVPWDAPTVATDADRAWCAEILPEVSRTFALSIQMLPESLRDAVGVAYLMCRIVDTIEDDADATQEVREALFDLFDGAVAHDDVPTRALATFGRTLGVPAERRLMADADAAFRVFRGLPWSQREAIRPWVLEMSRGMRGYTRRQAEHEGILRLHDLQDLERYCWYVAGTVGELLTSLFLDHLGAQQEDSPELRADAARFGLGLQLVNIVKDVAVDAERGVCFLPTATLDAHGVTPDQLLDPAHRDASLAALRDVLDRAREHLTVATRYANRWAATEDGGAVRLFCAVPLALAWLSLERVGSDPETLTVGYTPKVTRGEVEEVVRRAVETRRDPSGFSGWMGELIG